MLGLVFRPKFQGISPQFIWPEIKSTVPPFYDPEITIEWEIFHNV